MNLNEFETIEAAQAYTSTDKIIITSNVMRMMLVQTGLYGYITTNTDDTSLAITDSVKTDAKFNLIDGDPLGEANKLMMDSLISTHSEKAAELAALKAALLAYANPEHQPFANVTALEFRKAKGVYAVELPILGSKGQHVTEFGIVESVPEPAEVVLMQRFGTEGDLTEWHPVGSTRVLYKQSGYKIMVPACTADIRELKLVSYSDVVIS